MDGEPWGKRLATTTSRSLSLIINPPLPPPHQQLDTIRSRVALRGVGPSAWSMALLPPIQEFFVNPEQRLLFVSVVRAAGESSSATGAAPAHAVRITHTLPPAVLTRSDSEDPEGILSQLAYFICQPETQIQPGHPFEQAVQFGTLQGDALQDLVRVMTTVYTPLLARNSAWPNSVQNDFAAGMNRFMSALTDCVHRHEGHTYLYVPNEDLSGETAVLAKEKELVQRLETTVIHWTRQIKEVISASNTEDDKKTKAASKPSASGAPAVALNELPLGELQYWQRRCDDMSGIGEQLDRPAVTRIVEVLTAAKSSYLVQFNAWSLKIKDGFAQAESNLKFLTVLKEPCEQLSTAKVWDGTGGEGGGFGVVDLF